MKKSFLILLIISTLFTTGCWDMIEINNRIYPYTVGYDLVNAKDGRYLITYSYPNMAALGKNPSSDEKIILATTNANNLFEAMHMLATKVNLPIYLKHLKVVLLSDEVATQENLMREIVDGINRDFIANKNAQMLVVKDSANELLKIVSKIKGHEIVGGVLYNLLINHQNSTMFTSKTLTNFIEDVDISKTVIVPLVQIKGEELVVSGGAVFKNYGLIGYLTPEENRALTYLNNHANGDGVDIKYNGADLSLLISNLNSKKKLISKDENIKIKYVIKLEGQIHSYIIGDPIETNEKLEDMQKHVSAEVKAELEKTIEKVQKELKVDALQIADFLESFHPNVWEEIEDNWEEIYPEIEFEIEVDVFIRRRGLTK